MSSSSSLIIIIGSTRRASSSSDVSTFSCISNQLNCPPETPCACSQPSSPGPPLYPTFHLPDNLAAVLLCLAICPSIPRLTAANASCRALERHQSLDIQCKVALFCSPHSYMLKTTLLLPTIPCPTRRSCLGSFRADNSEIACLCSSRPSLPQPLPLPVPDYVRLSLYRDQPRFEGSLRLPVPAHKNPPRRNVWLG